jgi:prepilin-type N-terminal cleavage/methylation domain-containing protein
MTLVRSHSRGFTLLETVISIGVLAVLLSAFLAVFGPAATGIRRAISTQEADRLATALVSELSTLREGSQTTDFTSGFDKGFNWIKDGSTSGKTLFVYQYRANPSAGLRADGTMEPYTPTSGVAGKDYVVQPMVRQRDDAMLADDLAVLEGRVFAVKPTQLVFNQGVLELGTTGTITDPETGSSVSDSAAYSSSVIPFAAEFFEVPSSAPAFLKAGGAFDLSKLKSPLFARNLAVNR